METLKVTYTVNHKVTHQADNRTWRITNPLKGISITLEDAIIQSNTEHIELHHIRGSFYVDHDNLPEVLRNFDMTEIDEIRIERVKIL